LKHKAIKIFLIAAFGAVCALIASYYTANSINMAIEKSQANSILYELSYVIDALEETVPPKPEDSIIIEKLETILVTSLVKLRVMNPDLSVLQGTPKNTLCRIIKYSQSVEIAKNGIGKYRDKEVAKQAVSYLTVLEPKLQELSENPAIPLFECINLFGSVKN